MAGPRQAWLGILAVAATLIPVSGATGSVGDGLCVGPEARFDPAAEQALRSMTNTFRAENGIRPLRARAGLTRAARRHSLSMAESDSFAHSGNGRGFPWARNRPAGENLALAESPEAVMELLKGSAPHRRTLLSPTFRRFGVGVLRTCTGHLLVTEDFVG
jgi:uncharacterized protein YkwD